MTDSNHQNIDNDDNVEDFRHLTFEQALDRLGKTVEALESGGLSLDDATRLYEEGMGLARICSETLASAELRISRIRTMHGEQMRFIADNAAEYGVEP